MRTKEELRNMHPEDALDYIRTKVMDYYREYDEREREQRQKERNSYHEHHFY